MGLMTLGGPLTAADEIRPVTLPGTESHTIRSASIAQPLRIDISLPINYSETQKKYPVVYLIDSNLGFSVVSGTVRMLSLPSEEFRFPDLIVVGIGYDIDIQKKDTLQAFLDWRTRDLTPTRDVAWEDQREPKLPSGIESGGAGQFVTIIEEEIKPFINRRYRTDAKDETLAGCSFGGLFSLYTLLTWPDTFDSYIICSPSLWWDGGVMFDKEADYAKRHKDLAKTVFISVGDQEQTEAQAQFKMLSNMKEMVNRLRSRQYPSLQLKSVIIEGERHESVSGTAASKGLRWIFERTDTETP